MLPENRAFLMRGEDGREYGPADLGEIREWVLENRVGVGTDVRLDEPKAQWQPWQNYPELVALLAEAQVTCPVPGQPGLVLAPIWRRVVAWMMDITLLAIILNPVQLLLAHVMPIREIFQALSDPMMFQSLPTPVRYQAVAVAMIVNACLALYFTVCHAVYGRTPAKALLRIRVVDQNSQKPAAIKAFVRALVLILSVNLLFPLLCTFFNPQRRAFHDFVAGTYVVEA